MKATSKRFNEKVVIITGGTSGIGAATAKMFSKEGAITVITGRRVEKGERIVGQIRDKGGEAIYIEADHRQVKDCHRVVQKCIEQFGRIDVLFNNAGIVLKGTAEETLESDWQAVMDLNVTAVWRMSKLVIPYMRQSNKGVIINNASDWGLVGGKAAVAYCTSKGAVIQMTKAMALDHARENIRINAVCPGDTYVERWTEAGYYQNSEPVDEKRARAESGAEIPMGRVGEVEEIAQAVLFLASEEAAYITGTTLVVDGGNIAM
jgi:NAD(P)-dependent dehydrogenase (short-subunit alcohol dehydrogenase family)